MNNTINKLLFFLIILTITSCKDKDFEFQVINKTDFDIRRFDVDWCHSDTQVSLGPQESSDIITLSSKNKRLGSLCHGVTIYANVSGSITEYQNNCGFARTKDHFTTSKINKIIILENAEGDTSCVNNIFSFEYE